jgi:hypothetical protein
MERCVAETVAMHSVWCIRWIYQTIGIDDLTEMVAEGEC